MNIKKSYPSTDPLQVAPDTAAQPRSLLNARALWSLVAALVLVLIAGLAFVVTKPAGHQLKTLTLGESQAGSQSALQVGDMLQVNLEGNPSTGYTWSVEGLDAAVLTLVGEPEFHPASSALGAGGTVTYRFEAVGTGQTTLKLIYSRPFEKGVPPLKTFAASVLVTSQ
jgi:inhibitor of cysteine peptidase